ncbi:MAG: mechanosensitive ion channel family protein [Bacteroidetes Order II. Incertae sedis bacterium]|nr:mechanosensitive ion channel family protein [Bacteroidetes Order II. bacterium]
MIEWFRINISGDHAEELLISMAILVVGWVIRKLTGEVLIRKIEDPHHRFTINRRVGRSLAIATLVLVVAIWFPNLKEIVAILSLFGAGLAIVNREVILSMVAWLHIITRQPYGVGDRIELNGVSGDVIDISLLVTTMMETREWVQGDQSTGRIMRIPNNWVFLYAVKNYTQGFEYIWNELSVTVSDKSDWNMAREIMMSLAQESSFIVEHQVKSQLKTMTQEYLVYYSTLTPFVYVATNERGIQLTLRYLCKVRNRRGSEHAIMLRILEEFAKNPSIEMVFFK